MPFAPVPVSALDDMPMLPRRSLLLAAAGAWLPGVGRAYPGAPVPLLRPVVPPEVQAALDASGLPASSFGLYVMPLLGVKPGQPLPSSQVSRRFAGRAQAATPAPSLPPPLLSLNAESPFQLASTTKIVTSLAALDVLGPDYRWQTQAFLDGPLHEGKLLGDLVIVGGGDARLSTDALRGWFAQLQAQGLKEVWGDIVLDRFAFRLTETDYANTPLPTPERPYHARPDALTLDEGVLRVALQGRPTQRADIMLSPGMTGLRVVNELSPGKACAAWARVDPRSDGASQLVVRGQWSAACGGREIAQLALPHAEFTARAVAALWRDGGGRLIGHVVDKRAPDGLPPRPQPLPLLASLSPELPSFLPPLPDAPWASLPSQPLSASLREMNKNSDNLAARNLMLSLVRGFPQQPATLPAACARLREWLAAQGLAASDIEVDNGAGLSHAEKGRPRALVQLLARAWHSRHGQLFFDSLPIAGVDGTLQTRMTAGPATGRAHLKTGTLNDVRALAGYVQAASGRSFALAALVNHADAARALPALDALVEWVAARG